MKNNSGLSLIATVLTLLLFSLFIAVAVSLITTGANIGVQEEQGVQALYIAEGGIEKALKFLQDGGRCQDITGESSLTNIALGNGNFTVWSTLYRPTPSARLFIAIDSTQQTIRADRNLIPAGYAPTGRIIIQNEPPPPGTEAIDYYSISGDTFINCIRGVAWTTPSNHNANRRIIQNQCDIISTGNIASNPLASVRRQTSMSVQQ